VWHDKILKGEKKTPSVGEHVVTNQRHKRNKVPKFGQFGSSLFLFSSPLTKPSRRKKPLIGEPERVLIVLKTGSENDRSIAWTAGWIIVVLHRPCTVRVRTKECTPLSH